MKKWEHISTNASHGNNENKFTKIYILESFNMNVNFHNFCINTFGIYEQILSVDKDAGNMERADFRMQIISLKWSSRNIFFWILRFNLKNSEDLRKIMYYSLFSFLQRANFLLEKSWKNKLQDLIKLSHALNTIYSEQQYNDASTTVDWNIRCLQNN